MKNRGMTTADLTRALKIDNKEAQRIMDPRHATKTSRMVEAIKATGQQAVVELAE